MSPAARGGGEPPTATADEADTYPLLFSPLVVGPITLRNRVVNLAQGMGYTNRGRVEEEDTYYHRRRALGGVGLVVTGGTAAHASSQTHTRGFIEAYDPEVIPGLRRRSEAIHGAGAQLVGQLFNLGAVQPAESMSVVPLAPSAQRSPGFRYAPMAMGSRQIEEVVDGFRISARHFVAGGYDGLEIHASHGYLLAQFLSAVTNRRDDDYGGDLSGRSRFLLEVVRAVRAEVGADIVVGVRLSVDDEVPGGTDSDQAAALVELLGEHAPVDYLSLAIGVRGSYVKDSTAPEGIALERIAEVRRHARVPVVASQRIRTPDGAEAALQSGAADLIGMARALIADPDWARKARSGERERIRPCIGDVQDCRAHLSGGLHCMVNPEVGREVYLRRLREQLGGRRRPRRAVVVGAGPAGLEAACRLASAGLSVRVYEREDAAGGQLALASSAIGRAEWSEFLHFSLREARRLGVEVVLGALASADLVRESDPDAIVIATGATGRTLDPDLARGDIPAVTVWDTLRSPAAVRGNVVVLDDGSGDWPALTVAERLQLLGAQVTVLTADSSPFRSIPSESVAGLRRRLLAAGVRWADGARDVKVRAGSVSFAREGSDEVTDLPADQLVIEGGRRPDDELWRELDHDRRVYAVGDCQSPRGVSNAVADALLAAERIIRGGSLVGSPAS